MPGTGRSSLTVSGCVSIFPRNRLRQKFSTSCHLVSDPGLLGSDEVSREGGVWRQMPSGWVP